MIETQGELVVVGDKPKAQLSRAMPKMFKVSFSGVGKDVPTFAEASVIADEIVKNGGEWDEVSAYPPTNMAIGLTFHKLRIVSNHYLSAISYEARTTAVISAKALRDSEGFRRYEMEDDVSQELAEFALANAIYTALVEGHAAEISARRTAMENASNVSLALDYPEMER